MKKRDSILILLLLLLGPAYYFANKPAVAPLPELRDALNEAPRQAPAVIEEAPAMPPSGNDFRDAVRNDAVGAPPVITEARRPEQLPPFEKLPDVREITRETVETREVSPSAPQ